jgi:hypothetical protein
MNGEAPVLTIITTTSGRPEGLARLIQSIEAQTLKLPFMHLLLWDDYRAPGAQPPESYNVLGRRFSIVFPPGWAKAETYNYSVGPTLATAAMMLVKTPWATFADDDVWWEPDHLRLLDRAVGRGNVHWATTLRYIWSPEGRKIGVDRFESVGDAPTRNVPYEMCDSNAMIFRREIGVPGAAAIRDTKGYDADRLLYQFFKQHGGPREQVLQPTIHQVCPERLTAFFQANCSPA